jgi:ATP-dependent DNA ligase
MAARDRKDGPRVRHYGRPVNELTRRFPPIVDALSRLRSRSCITSIFLYAFDLLELNGDDLRRDSLELRKAMLASIVSKTRSGIRFNERIEGEPTREAAMAAFAKSWRRG